MKAFKILSATLLNMIVGVILSIIIGISPAYGAIGAPLLAALAGNFFPAGSLNAGVLTEIWTGEVVKRLDSGIRATFLEGINDYSRYVNNDVIHLIGQGVDPDVLINNSTYPLELKVLNDDDLTFQLDKYQTTPTPITDDELYAMSYDKMSVVKDKHSDVLLQTRFRKALFSLAPAAHSASTPVLLTTGSANDDGYLSITKKDIIKLKNRFDRLKVPNAGRRLVLCTQHIKDLLEQDQKFADQYYNYTTGKIANLYSFQVYEYADCPYYTSAAVKVLWGVPLAGTDRQASIAFYAPHVFLAGGSINMYYREAATDPENQRSLVSFRNYFVCLPKKAEAYAAIVSADIPATPDPEPEPDYITATPPSLAFVAAGESKDVAVTASAAWGVSGTVTGFSATKKGDGSGVTIVATANESTTDARSGVFTVDLDDDATVAAIIAVSQPAATE